MVKEMEEKLCLTFLHGYLVADYDHCVIFPIGFLRAETRCADVLAAVVEQALFVGLTMVVGMALFGCRDDCGCRVP